MNFHEYKTTCTDFGINEYKLKSEKEMCIEIL